MSSPSSIDLFAFPDLVVRQIAQSFDHISFVKFSLCSTTANQVAESVRTFRKPDCFTVDYDPKCSYAAFQLRCDKTRFGMELNDNSFTFFVWDGSDIVDEAALDASQLPMFSGMFDSWSNKKAVFKLTAYLQKLFNYKAHLDLSWAQRVWNIGEILNAMPSLRGVTFAANDVSDEKYTDLLYNDKCFHLQVNLCDDLPGTLKDLDVTKIKAKYFTARSAKWITLDHLLDWDFIYVEAKVTRITSTDMNIFLTQWMNGLKPNARTLIINVTHPPQKVDVTLRELDAELKSETKQLQPCHFSELESEKKKLYPDHFSGFERFEELKGGYEIRSEDGATARIFFDKYRNSELYTTVTCYFWPPDY